MPTLFRSKCRPLIIVSAKQHPIGTSRMHRWDIQIICEVFASIRRVSILWVKESTCSQPIYKDDIWPFNFRTPRNNNLWIAQVLLHQSWMSQKNFCRATRRWNLQISPQDTSLWDACNATWAEMFFRIRKKTSPCDWNQCQRRHRSSRSAQDVHTRTSTGKGHRCRWLGLSERSYIWEHNSQYGNRSCNRPAGESRSWELPTMAGEASGSKAGEQGQVYRLLGCDCGHGEEYYRSGWPLPPYKEYVWLRCQNNRLALRWL